MAGYACRINEQNMGAIASENPNFDLDEVMVWLLKHEYGFFVRDEGSAFDCQYITDEIFHTLYSFESPDDGDIFRRVLRL